MSPILRVALRRPLARSRSHVEEVRRARSLVQHARREWSHALLHQRQVLHVVMLQIHNTAEDNSNAFLFSRCEAAAGDVTEAKIKRTRNPQTVDAYQNDHASDGYGSVFRAKHYTGLPTG